MDKEQLAIARLQDAARLSEHRYKKPLMVTYSGGKDSQVLVALSERAGINFEVVNSHTTADAPETVYFIREQFKAMEERGIKCSMLNVRKAKGLPCDWQTGMDVFRWWMEDDNVNGQLSMDDLMEDNNV